MMSPHARAGAPPGPNSESRDAGHGTALRANTNERRDFDLAAADRATARRIAGLRVRAAALGWQLMLGTQGEVLLGRWGRVRDLTPDGADAFLASLEAPP
jgi:hypothetical protein